MAVRAQPRGALVVWNKELLTNPNLPGVHDSNVWSESNKASIAREGAQNGVTEVRRTAKISIILSVDGGSVSHLSGAKKGIVHTSVHDKHCNEKVANSRDLQMLMAVAKNGKESSPRQQALIVKVVEAVEGTPGVPLYETRVENVVPGVAVTLEVFGGNTHITGLPPYFTSI